jgi:hypothetical protein
MVFVQHVDVVSMHHQKPLDSLFVLLCKMGRKHGDASI